MSVMTAEASGTPPRSKYDRLIAAARPFRRCRPSWCIPATKVRCAARWSGGSRDHQADPRRACGEDQGIAAKHSLNIAGYEIVDAPHSEAAAAARRSK